MAVTLYVDYISFATKISLSVFGHIMCAIWNGEHEMSNTSQAVHSVARTVCFLACRCDSIAWNPHKMLGAPLQCSPFIVRHKVGPDGLAWNGIRSLRYSFFAVM